MQRGFAAVQVLDEFADPAGETELGGFFGALVSQRNLQTFVQEGQLAQALRQRIKTVRRLIEDRRIGMKRDFRSGLAGLASLLEL